MTIYSTDLYYEVQYFELCSTRKIIYFAAEFTCPALTESDAVKVTYTDEKREPYSKVNISCTNNYDLGERNSFQCIPNPDNTETGIWSPTPDLSLCITGKLYQHF